MTVREAANNAVHHSGTGRIVLSAEPVGDSVTICVRDYGRGIDAATVVSPPSGHFGLLGMRERMKRLGGGLEINSRPGEGTTVMLQAPRTSPRTLDPVGKS